MNKFAIKVNIAWICHNKWGYLRRIWLSLELEFSFTALFLSGSHFKANNNSYGLLSHLYYLYFNFLIFSIDIFYFSMDLRKLVGSLLVKHDLLFGGKMESDNWERNKKLAFIRDVRQGIMIMSRTFEFCLVQKFVLFNLSLLCTENKSYAIKSFVWIYVNSRLA